MTLLKIETRTDCEWNGWFLDSVYSVFSSIFDPLAGVFGKVYNSLLDPVLFGQCFMKVRIRLCRVDADDNGIPPETSSSRH